MTLVAAPRASSTAPVPRPPQPISPILISLTPRPPAACTSGTCGCRGNGRTGKAKGCLREKTSTRRFLERLVFRCGHDSGSKKTQPMGSLDAELGAVSEAASRLFYSWLSHDAGRK